MLIRLGPEPLNDKRTILGYEAKLPTPRVWGLSRPVCLLVFGFCAFTEFAGWFATNGRINGGDDVAFVVVFAGVGVVALMNALRPIRPAR
jgi:hypothetical protein